MTCEEARWQEFESEEARAHAAGCAECGEWMGDGMALRALAAEVVPARPRKRPVPGRGVWVGVAVACAAAMALVAVLPEWEVTPPPMPVVALTAEPVVVEVEASRTEPAKRTPTKRRAVVEPVVVRLETADPDVVIYWTFESGGVE